MHGETLKNMSLVSLYQIPVYKHANHQLWYGHEFCIWVSMHHKSIIYI